MRAGRAALVFAAWLATVGAAPQKAQADEVAGQVAGRARRGPPNIVILLADDVGMGDVGCFGNRTIRTPHIDSLAHSGVKLTHHLAASSLCTPSRAALLTARYPIRTGMTAHHRMRVIPLVASGGGLPSNETTIAKVLRESGYVTALIGKWHLGLSCNIYGDFCHHPRSHGFNYFYGIPLSNLKDFGDDDGSVIVSQNPRLKPGLQVAVLLMVATTLGVRAKGRVSRAWTLLILTFLVFPVAFFLFFISNIKMWNSVLMRQTEIVEQPILLQNLTQRFSTEAVDFIETQHSKGKPFFLLMSFHQTHTALKTSPRFEGVSLHGAYGDNLEEMDWGVGQVLKALKKLDVDDNTIVYFTSDQGGHLEERGRFGREGGHNGIYKGGKCQGGMEGGVRVPTLISWPGRLPAGKEVAEVTSQMDMMDTFVSLAGLPPVPDTGRDGKDLTPLLYGRNQTSPHQLIVHYCGDEIHAARYIPASGGKVWKVHYATPKWIPGTQGCGYVCSCWDVNRHSPPLLYEITADPAEDHPLDPAAHQDVLAHIARLVRVHKNSVVPVESQFSLGKMMWRPWLQPWCCITCVCRDPVFYPDPAVLVPSVREL